MKVSDKPADEEIQGELKSDRFIKFQCIITRLSSEFINMPLDKLDEAMKTAMAFVGDFCDIFRSSIWTFNWKTSTATRLVSWDKYKDEKDTGTVSLPFSAIEPVIECNSRGEVLYASGNDEFNRNNAKKLQLQLDMNYSLSVFPLMIGSNLLGCISLLNDMPGRQFSETEHTMIEIFAHMIANVLQRKERELELRQHYENDRLVLDAIREGVIMFDYDGNIININRHLAERYGGTVGEIIGTNVFEHVDPVKYAGFLKLRQEKVRQTYNTGIPCAFEDAKDGLTFSNRCFPVYRNGSICAVALFTSDVTPLKRAMEESTKRAEYQARLRVITEFFTNISHEFKTPLTLVFNAEKLIEDRVRNVTDCENKEFMTKYLGMMRQNINRLLRLIGNLLDVTKLDSGFMQVNLQELDIACWLDTMVASIKDYAQRRGIEIITPPVPPMLPLLTDVDKLERILLNLLSNAIKHTPSGGHIRVSLACSEHSVILSVEDDGEGIPDDKQEIIFDRFKQVNTSLTRASEGSGIGLALAKLLTELLDGRIWFESQYGKGSTFYVELPVSQNKQKTKTSYVDGMDIAGKVEMEFSDII